LGTITASPISIAAIDLDGTLLDGQSQELFIRFLARRGAVPMALLCYVLFVTALYRFGRQLDFAAIQRRVIASFAGMDVNQLQKLTDDFVTMDLVPRIRRDGWQEVVELQQAGAQVVLVSGTLRPFVEGVAAQVGVTSIVATRLPLLEHGRISDSIIDGTMLMGPAKLRALQAHADEVFGVGNWRLWRAYGDHEADIELLDAADEAIVVCPTAGLRAIARKRGWKTIVWQ
jgi:HAD superfamily hydrolase (TIGR01490 family)